MVNLIFKILEVTSTIWSFKLDISIFYSYACVISRKIYISIVVWRVISEIVHSTNVLKGNELKRRTALGWQGKMTSAEVARGKDGRPGITARRRRCGSRLGKKWLGSRLERKRRGTTPIKRRGSRLCRKRLGSRWCGLRLRKKQLGCSLEQKRRGTRLSGAVARGYAKRG